HDAPGALCRPLARTTGVQLPVCMRDAARSRAFLGVQRGCDGGMAPLSRDGLLRGTALAEGVSVERDSDARSDAAPTWRMIMKKLAAIIPVALLPALTGCNVSTIDDSSEDLGEAAEASTVAGSWHSMPVPSTAGDAYCSYTSGSTTHEIYLKLQQIG